MKISLLGTGIMGTPMAERLLNAGYELTIYNRTLEKTKALKKKGAKIGQTPAEAIYTAE